MSCRGQVLIGSSNWLATDTYTRRGLLLPWCRFSRWIQHGDARDCLNAERTLGVLTTPTYDGMRAYGACRAVEKGCQAESHICHSFRTVQMPEAHGRWSPHFVGRPSCLSPTVGALVVLRLDCSLS